MSKQLKGIINTIVGEVRRYGNDFKCIEPITKRGC